MSIRSRTYPLRVALAAGFVALPLAAVFAVDPGQAGATGPEVRRPDGARAAVLRGRVTDEAGVPGGS
jgi:hypothetical protein